MRVKVNGRFWMLNFVASREIPASRLGDCDPPDCKGKQIRVRRSLSGEHRLEIVIHELLHAANWHASEEWVGTTAADLARILTRLGYTDATTTK